MLKRILAAGCFIAALAASLTVCHAQGILDAARYARPGNEMFANIYPTPIAAPAEPMLGLNPAHASQSSLMSESQVIVNDPGTIGAEFWGGSPDAFAPIERHVGRGEPLQGTSWLNRPYSAGWFFGGLSGDELLDGRVSMHTDAFGGYRFGWDRDHFWGAELRLGWGAIDLEDTPPPTNQRTGDVFMIDLNYLRYVWGDAKWRPFWSIGLGVATFDFEDAMGVDYNETLVNIPLGIGVKYQHRRWLAWRAELTDNIALANGGLETMQNFSFTFGAEIRFGFHPRTYWPWKPDRYIW